MMVGAADERGEVTGGETEKCRGGIGWWYIYIYRGWKGLEERGCIYLHHANGSNHKRSL